jgi:surface polysaccharide O-acyltransferase-like enzyme
MAVTIAPKAPSGPDRPGQATPHSGGAGEQRTASRGRLEGADALRALAALAVIVVHTTHWALQDQGADAAVWYSVTLLARFCVPAFVLLTGLVLAYRYGEQPLGRDFLLRRARRTLLPWVIWAPIFCVADIAWTGEIHADWGAVRDWWSLGAGHLYFLILVPQLYLLMLLWPARRRTSAVAAGVAVAVQIALCAVRLYAPMQGGLLQQGVLNHGFEGFPFWIGWFAIGVAAGRSLAGRGRAATTPLRAWPFATAIAPAAFVLLWLDTRGMASQSYATGTGAFLRPLILPFTLAVCGAAVLGAPAVLRRMPRLQRATMTFSRHSLGVYIVHPLLIAAVGRAIAGGLHQHLPWSIGPVLLLTASVAAGALLVSALLARTRLAPAIGEARPHPQRRHVGAERERERDLLGRAQPAARAGSPQRSSRPASSASSRSTSGGDGMPATRRT